MPSLYEYRPVRFFTLTAVVTWVPWFLAVSAQSRPGMEAGAALLMLGGLLGPLAVGLFLIMTSGNPALKADFKDRLVNLRRIRPTFLLTAVVMPLAVIALAMGLSLALGQSRDQFRLADGASSMGTVVLTMVLAPIIEETGWRGYGVDSLRAKTGMLKAAVLFGVLWSAWHAPLVLIHGTYQNELARMENPLFLVNFFVSVIPAAIIANWFYERNDRSIIFGVVLHSALNGAAVLLNASQVTKGIVTVLYAVIAVVLIMRDRAGFSAGPLNALKPAAPSCSSLEPSIRAGSTRSSRSSIPGVRWPWPGS